MSAGDEQSAKQEEGTSGSQTEEGTREPSGLLLGLLALLLSAAAFFPAVGGPFLWDDRYLVEDDLVRQLHPIADYFRNAFWQANDTEPYARSYYRPMVVLSFALDNALHSGNPAGFHSTNLVLHGINSALAFSLARRIGAGAWPSLVGALSFGWAPRLSEAVAWISGRTDVLATTFCLVALLLTMSEWRWRRIGAAVALLLGLLSKEVALAGVLGAVAFELGAERGVPWRRRWVNVVPIGAACAVYGVARTSVLSSPAAPPGLDLAERGLAALQAIGYYASMIADAWRPTTSIGFLGVSNAPVLALGVATSIALAVGLGKWRPSPKPWSLCVAAMVALALVLHVVPINVNVVAADRFLYLPLAMLGPLLAVVLSSVRPRWLAGAALVVASYFPAAWLRAHVYSDDVDFWANAYQERTAHDAAVADVGLCRVFAEAGLFEEAIEICLGADEHDVSNYAFALHNGAVFIAMDGDDARAIPMLQHAAKIHTLPKAHWSLAMAFARQSRAPEAWNAVQNYSELAPMPERVKELEQLVTGVLDSAAQRQSNPTSIDERVAQAAAFEQAAQSRVAMRVLLGVARDPGANAMHLRVIFGYAERFGTPEQLEEVFGRLRAVDPDLGSELHLVVDRRLERAKRLRAVVRELRPKPGA